MGKPSRLAKEQQAALGRLKRIPALAHFYLAGGSGIACHLGHRRSLDLEIVSGSKAVLKIRLGNALVDIVRYQYPPLKVAPTGPGGFPTASLLDLAAMKLAAIATRGIRRDFWDLFEILQTGLELSDAGKAYCERFGLDRSDLYHVTKSLSFFDDAQRKPYPAGLTPKKWSEIKRFFEAEAPKLLLG